MSSDEALARRAGRLSALESDRAALLRLADGFVVVSWWQDRSGQPRKGLFDYEWRETLNEALDLYREYQDGEYARGAAMGIFSADAAGMPLRRLDPLHLIRLMRETRAA